MRILFTIALMFLSVHAAADGIDPPLPALYAVTGVAADDMLNIRAAPDGDAVVIGRLASNARDVEVITLSREGRWALVNHVENSGWVAMRFLVAQDKRLTSLGLPQGLKCFGTEPFWSITFSDRPVLEYAAPGQIIRSAIVDMSPSPENVAVTEFGVRFVWRSNSDNITAHILPGRCTDGMSDRTYGLHYVADGGPLTGCCSLN